ncbi:dioxygenase family protein [Streptacidiphilus melanogenes]|uniref:dioxygenase family protein n=1 Tax=Streptacidiphilus melanogenes TaxID=411235 RepID=UPI0006939D5E|nr:dioxygenase [Streptacidiphilus melanogenes]
MDSDEQAASALTEAVVASFAGAADARTREVLEAVVRHAHALVRELRLTREEWRQAVDHLTAVGQACDDTRQECVLLSDVLGISSLVEAVNGEPEGTAGTVLGPFHLTDSPVRALGDSIDLVGTGTPCVVTGRVTGPDGAPVSGASVDVWQCDEHGFYDVQQPEVQPTGNGRGLFTADAEGRFRFRTVVPSPYPIPTDGPVGRLLNASRRHPYRPAHIHLIAAAPGFRTLTTHLFVADSPYLDSDAVFAVKPALVVDFAEIDDPEQAARHGVTAPFRHADFDVRLVLDDPGEGSE